MESKIIKVGTSLGLIVPGSFAKEYGLKFGTKIELIRKENGEFVVRKKANAREGWAEAFAQYAKEGEDELLLPDFIDSETDSLL